MYRDLNVRPQVTYIGIIWKVATYLLKVKDVTRDMSPKTRHFLSHIIQFLQAFVDRSDLMLLKRVVGH